MLGAAWSSVAKISIITLVHVLHLEVFTTALQPSLSQIQASNYSVSRMANWSDTGGVMKLKGSKNVMILLDLNSLVRPTYQGQDVRKSLKLVSQFFITKLPEKGTLYQAFRDTPCLNGTLAWFPLSCSWCCGNKFSSELYDIPGVTDPLEMLANQVVPTPHCCSKVDDAGNRIFTVGDPITTAPSKVTIVESGFVWFLPQVGQVGSPYTSIQFQVQYWRADSPPLSLPTSLDSGCEQDRKLCEISRTWCLNKTEYSQSLKIDASCCGRCTVSKTVFTVDIEVDSLQEYPQVGFGGHMIAFDGGDDFMVTEFGRMPKYEFGIQFWFQQNRLSPGQTILTWWTETRGREFEIADSSNIFFYHLNNRSQATGVGINDGKWHHVCFSFRLVCPDSVKVPGAKYCILPGCDAEHDCLHFEINVIVDGFIAGTSYLPPFIPSSNGKLVWGQRVLKTYLSSERVLKANLFKNLQDNGPAITSNIEVEFTDRELQLIYSRIRSGYLNDSIIFQNLNKMDTTGWVSTEDQPWRDPHFKYCEAVGGDFDPFSALSANIDEIRMYSYFRMPQDVAIDINIVLSGDNFYTYSNRESNVSLILYLNFDLDHSHLLARSQQVVQAWPLDIEDQARQSEDLAVVSSVTTLGSGIFAWAPLQVPSTAPLRGSRTIQITLPDNEEPIPINLVDIAIEEGRSQYLIYSRIDVAPKYGELRAASDDCDIITTVDTSGNDDSAVSFRSAPACMGGVLDIYLVGGISAATLTRNCSVGDTISADDGYGHGFLATVSAVSSSGAIQEMTIQSYGSGYDWLNASRTDVIMSSGRCKCGDLEGNVKGNMRQCMSALIGTGKADVSGKGFAGVDLSGTSAVYTYGPTSCTNGLCPAVKPRPCAWACYRTQGWMTDMLIAPTSAPQYYKFMAGPYSEFSQSVQQYIRGFPPVYWSNQQHTVWYVPTQFSRDGIQNDNFLVRKFGSFPKLEIFATDMIPPPPRPHAWVEIVQERLAMPLNTSIIWEANSPMVIHFQILDFDRGTCVLNSPFEVTVDLPSRGALYQAVQINRSDPNFERDCICMNAPRFPLLNRMPDMLYYPPETSTPGSVRCDVSKIGNFCMKMGPPILSNDAIVSQYEETILIPGFQHARHGFHVVYYMGDTEFGSASLQWRMKHPQGQVQNASVRIEVRRSNSPPLTLNLSVVAFEDTAKEIQLKAIDIDDGQKPNIFIIQYPSHGELYQCDAETTNVSCTLGDRVSSVNDSTGQWAIIEEDELGAIDDSISKVSQAFSAYNSTQENERTRPVNSNASQVLYGGFGFASWNFDPEIPQNFRRMCGSRGTVAARLVIKNPVFVTNIEIFASLGYDTPFRLLAKAPHPMKQVGNDYNLRPNGALGSFPKATTTISIKSDDDRAHSSDEIENRDTFEFASISKEYRISCGGSVQSHGDSVCLSQWNDSKLSKGEFYNFSDNEAIEWLELYRGLPHQAQASKDRISPIFSPASFQTSEFRIEACGHDGRSFGQTVRKFLDKNLVRITGSPSLRPKGVVTSSNYRIVYVPHHNWNGQDSFSYSALDHAGGANRSSPRFSTSRAWSPQAFVSISVSQKPDSPQGTRIVVSSPPTDGISTILIPVGGTQTGPTGSDTDDVLSFIVEIIEVPWQGTLLDRDGSLFVSPTVTSELRYRPPYNVCGSPYAWFTYLLRNLTIGGSLPSSIYNATIDIRCSVGFICSEAVKQCIPCPAGRYGHGSGVLNSCFLCAPGKFQDKINASTCSICFPGSFAPDAGSTSCVLCPPGTITTKFGARACTPCESGTFAPLLGSTLCHECGQGSYTKKIGSTACTDCPNNTWTRSRQSGSLLDCECVAGFYVIGGSGMPCLPCPHGAYCHGRGLLPVPKTGYWTSMKLWTESNRTQMGDSRWMALNTSGVAVFVPCAYRYVRGVCIGYPDVNVQEEEEICQYRNGIVHQGPSKIDAFTSEGISVVTKICTLLLPNQVPTVGPRDALRSWSTRQNYSSNFYCSEGYDDIMCSKCAKGFTRGLLAYCSKCSIFFTVPFINVCYFGGVACVNLVGWFSMIAAVSYPARSFHLLVTHLQLLAVLGRLSVPWPQLVQGPLHFCSWFNFNFDSFNWNCLDINLESSTIRWILDAVTPWIVIMGTVGSVSWSLRNAFVVVEAAKRQASERARKGGRKQRTTSDVGSNASRTSLTHLVEGSDRGGVSKSNVETQSSTTIGHGSASAKSDVSSDNSSDSGDSVESSSSATSKGSLGSKKKRKLVLLPQKDRDKIVPLTPKEIRKLQDSAIWYVVLLYNIFFIMATMNIFVPFSCSKVTSDFTYLDWNPKFLCGTGEHAMLQNLSIGLFLIWIVIIPAVLLFILWKAWQMELIRDRLFSRRFGWLLQPYEMKYYWWEQTILIRKLAVVASQGLFVHNAYLQLLIITSYSALHLAFTFYCRPHVYLRHTILDLWLQGQFLMLSCYAFANISGKDGLRIVNVLFGIFNENVRESILAPYPNMESIADRLVNSLAFSNFAFVTLFTSTIVAAMLMVAFDVYELRPNAPVWAPYLYNSISGMPLQRWHHDISKGLSLLDNFIGLVKYRKKRIPPERPPSRWAHRVMERSGEARSEEFWSSKSLTDMIDDVVAATQEEEWPRNRESVVEYIHSLDRRIFAAEMHNSKSSNLPALERERNNAKKILLRYVQRDLERTYKLLYDQAGRNEKLLAEIAEMKRREQHIRILIVGKEEEKRFTDLEYEQQERRIIEVQKWKQAYESEKKHSDELTRKVKQARDAAVLYYLEESTSSEDEREIDDYLKRRVEEYIGNKTAKDMMDDGKMDPIPKL